MRRWRWWAGLVASVAALEVTAWVLGREPTRSRVAPGWAVLVYDDGCGICRSLAGFLGRHARTEVQLVGFSELPRDGILETLAREEIEASAHFVTSEGIEYHGGESVTQAARLLPGGCVAGHLDRPVLRGLREVGYRLFAWRRGWFSRLT